MTISYYVKSAFRYGIIGVLAAGLGALASLILGAIGVSGLASFASMPFFAALAGIALNKAISEVRA